MYTPHIELNFNCYRKHQTQLKSHFQQLLSTDGILRNPVYEFICTKYLIIYQLNIVPQENA